MRKLLAVWLVFDDADSVLPGASWGVYVVDRFTTQLLNLAPPVAGYDLWSPVFGQTNGDGIAFEAVDRTTGQSTVLTASLGRCRRTTLSLAPSEKELHHRCGKAIIAVSRRMAARETDMRRVHSDYRIGVGIGAVCLAVAAAWGCSNAGNRFYDQPAEQGVNPASTTSSRLLVDVAPPNDVVDEPVTGGQKKDFVYELVTPPADGPFEAAAFNLQDSLESLTVVDPPAPLAVGHAVTPAVSPGATAQVTVRVSSAADVGVVCGDAGFAYGPITVPLDGSDSSTDPVDATPATLETTNEGNASFCISVVPSESAVVTLTQVALDVEVCDIEADDIEGTWEGEFTCTSDCDDDFGGPVSIEIVQEGFNATYGDGSGEFRGTVCGSRFQFSGGTGCVELVCDEIESGTFTRTGDDTAIKTSTYEFSVPGGRCSGTCNDTLTRVSGTP